MKTMHTTMVGFTLIAFLLAMGILFIGVMIWGLHWESTEPGDRICNYTVMLLCGMSIAFSMAAKHARLRKI